MFYYRSYFSGFFTKDESEEIIKNGSLNALFVLGRSIGFIGHFLDQKRLKQGLYRHPWDDISYVLPEINQWNLLINVSRNLSDLWK